MVRLKAACSAIRAAITSSAARSMMSGGECAEFERTSAVKKAFQGTFKGVAEASIPAVGHCKHAPTQRQASLSV
jgi:hypothetical protein